MFTVIILTADEAVGMVARFADRATALDYARVWERRLGYGRVAFAD